MPRLGAAKQHCSDTVCGSTQTELGDMPDADNAYRVSTSDSV